MGSLKSLFFPQLPKPISNDELEANRARRIRNIVASVSTGNVSLARGAFMTEEDVERLRRETTLTKKERHKLGK